LFEHFHLEFFACGVPIAIVVFVVTVPARGPLSKVAVKSAVSAG
jgi:hypothetical protein